jgi:hypothetical protein
MDFHKTNRQPLTVETMDLIDAQLREVDMFAPKGSGPANTPHYTSVHDTIQSPPNRSDEDRFGEALDFLEEEPVDLNDGGFDEMERNCHF